MRFLHRRFSEYFASEIALSIVGTFFLNFIVKKITGAMAICVMLLCLVLNIICIYRCLMSHIYRAGKKKYLNVNLKVFLVFAAINLVMARLNLEPFYTWLFLPYKIFTILGAGKVFSAVIVNLIMLFFILIVLRSAAPSKKRRSRHAIHK